MAAVAAFATSVDDSEEGTGAGAAMFSLAGAVVGAGAWVGPGGGGTACARTSLRTLISPRAYTTPSAATASGSSRLPTRLLMMRRASGGSYARWYGRFVVKASKVSATAMTRASKGIWSPFNP